MSWREDIVVMACAVPVLYLLTQPEDLRRHRWLRIVCSLPLIFCVLTFFLPMFIGGLGILAVMWSDVLSHYTGGWITDILHTDVSSETGIKPDFRYARNHRRDGEWHKAIAAIRHELTKDPKNFEGLLLLSEIYKDLAKPGEAIKQLNTILENPDATPDQKGGAQRKGELPPTATAFGRSGVL